MVSIQPGVICDPCLAPLVRALNASDELPKVPTVCGPEPIATIASCCGHGNNPASVIMADGSWLVRLDAAQVARVFEFLAKEEDA